MVSRLCANDIELDLSVHPPQLCPLVGATVNVSGAPPAEPAVCNQCGSIKTEQYVPTWLLQSLHVTRRSVLQCCVIAYGAYTQSRTEYMCGLNSNSVSPSGKPFHSGTVLIFFYMYVLCNCGTHQANPNWGSTDSTLTATLPFIFISPLALPAALCCSRARSWETNDVSSQ